MLGPDFCGRDFDGKTVGEWAVIGCDRDSVKKQCGGKLSQIISPPSTLGRFKGTQQVLDGHTLFSTLIGKFV